LNDYHAIDQMILQLTYDPEKIARLRAEATHTAIVEAFMAKKIQEH